VLFYEEEHVNQEKKKEKKIGILNFTRCMLFCIEL